MKKLPINKKISIVSPKSPMSPESPTGYGYTPASDCGLGFVGDCWENGTPLIGTHKLDGFFQSEIDTLIVDGYKKLPRVINKLITSQDLQQHYSQNGKLRFDNHLTAKAVGDKYLEIINQVLTGQS